MRLTNRVPVLSGINRGLTFVFFAFLGRSSRDCSDEGISRALAGIAAIDPENHVGDAMGDRSANIDECIYGTKLARATKAYPGQRLPKIHKPRYRFQFERGTMEYAEIPR